MNRAKKQQGVFETRQEMLAARDQLVKEFFQRGGKVVYGKYHKPD